MINFTVKYRFTILLLLILAVQGLIPNKVYAGTLEARCGWMFSTQSVTEGNFRDLMAAKTKDILPFISSEISVQAELNNRVLFGQSEENAYAFWDVTINTSRDIVASTARNILNCGSGVQEKLQDLARLDSQVSTQSRAAIPVMIGDTKRRQHEAINALKAVAIGKVQDVDQDAARTILETINSTAAQYKSCINTGGESVCPTEKEAFIASLYATAEFECPISGDYNCRYCTATPELDPDWVSCNEAAIAANRESDDPDGVSGGETPRVQKDQGIIIPCDTNCTWADLYVLVKNIIDFCLFYLAIPLSVISIAWAGWLYLVAGFNEANKTKAREILTGVLIGLCVALGAWLIVHFIVDALVKPEVAKTFPTEMKTETAP